MYLRSAAQDAQFFDLSADDGVETQDARAMALDGTPIPI